MILWCCPRCTFHNHHRRILCEMCLFARPSLREMDQTLLITDDRNLEHSQNRVRGLLYRVMRLMSTPVWWVVRATTGGAVAFGGACAGAAVGAILSSSYQSRGQGGRAQGGSGGRGGPVPGGGGARALRGAGLGALAGAIVCVEALQASQSLLRRRPRPRTSPTPPTAAAADAAAAELASSIPRTTLLHPGARPPVASARSGGGGVVVSARRQEQSGGTAAETGAVDRRVLRGQEQRIARALVQRGGGGGGGGGAGERTGVQPTSTHHITRGGFGGGGQVILRTIRGGAVLGEAEAAAILRAIHLSLEVDSMSYEELYEAFGGPPTTPALDQAAIQRLPIVKFQSGAVTEESPDSSAHTCSICLEEYAQGESLKKLPICGHMFHSVCIGKWLEEQGVCPICRKNVEPKEGD